MRCVGENGRPPDRACDQRALEPQIKTSNQLTNDNKILETILRSQREKDMSQNNVILDVTFQHIPTDLEQVTRAAANLMKIALCKYLSKRKLQRFALICKEWLTKEHS